MRNEESQTELGIIRIHRDVIASIACLAAQETEGVWGVGRSPGNELFGLFGIRRRSAVKIHIDKNEEVRIEMPIIVKYGFNVPEVAAKTQDNVRSRLEKTTDLVVRDININICGIERGAK